MSYINPLQVNDPVQLRLIVTDLEEHITQLEAVISRVTHNSYTHIVIRQLRTQLDVYRTSHRVATARLIQLENTQTQLPL